MKTAIYAVILFAAGICGGFAQNIKTAPKPAGQTLTVPPPPLDSQRFSEGYLDYTGSIFSPFSEKKPYNFGIYNKYGFLIAYIDQTHLVGERLEKLIGKKVIVKGRLMLLKKDLVIIAEDISFKNKSNK